MEIIINFFHEWLLIILTAVLALATIVLAFFTFFLWQETKKSRKFQQEIYQPDVGICRHNRSRCWRLF